MMEGHRGVSPTIFFSLPILNLSLLTASRGMWDDFGDLHDRSRWKWNNNRNDLDIPRYALIGVVSTAGIDFLPSVNLPG